MLSILIPTYHYNAYPLVKELVKQAVEANLIFELICLDDGSLSKLNLENKKINTLTNCKFIEASKNMGRSASRQFLATEDRKSTRLNSSHVRISYAVFCLKKKKKIKPNS